MNKFASIVLGDYIETLTDYHANGSYETLKKNVTLKSSSDYAIMIRTLNFERPDFEKDLIYLNEKEYNYLSKTKVYPNDILMNKIANPGSVYLMPDLYKPVSLAMNLFLIRFNKKVNQRFMYYLMKTNEDYIKLFANGTTTLTITKDSVKSLVLKVPSLDNQSKIAQVLANIDTKIQLNNKINTELEAMAKLIYDYWFVQFDFPDENGKPYKSSGGKMVYNEELKREIPHGWSMKELSEIANITMGQSPSGSSYNDDGEGLIFFQGSTDFGYRFPLVRKYTTEPSRLAKVGDILLSVRAPVGTLNIADNDCCIGRGLAALNSKDGANSFLCYVMLYFKQIFDRRNTSGTTFGSITKDDLFSLKLVYPSHEMLCMYDSKVATFNLKILNNHQQNKRLERLRDWLTPMLMNGQVTIKHELNISQ